MGVERIWKGSGVGSIGTFGFLKAKRGRTGGSGTEVGLGAGGTERIGNSEGFEKDFPLRVTTETYGARILSSEISPQTKKGYLGQLPLRCSPPLSTGPNGSFPPTYLLPLPLQ